MKRFSVHIAAGVIALVFASIQIVGSSAPAADQKERPTVKSPLEALQAIEYMEIDPGLQIELVACEPDVIDPVSIRFDEDGRMWVVQMRDYPHGPAAGEEPISRISILEDTDGDGRYETARVFADHLLFVTAVQPWRGGAIVTLAGRVAYMKDTDGDGRADHEETWYTGFAEENSQLRANHPWFALDNHIYVSNGNRGGTVVDATKKNARPVPISGMDFRFDPLTHKYEAVSGMGQFGIAFDDWGNRFMCSNRNPCKHIVLEDRYLKRNPLAAISAVFQDVAAAGDDSHLFPISRAWQTSTLHAGQYTAACGVRIYQGDALPAEYRGNVFTCDPTGDLIHREIIEPAGATFRSHPVSEGTEFFRTPDEWCRPVNTCTGPDGAMYVVDMYRGVIEHPQFMPDELKTRPDLRYGDDRGRIYRIAPKGGIKGYERPQLSKASGEQLVALLERENGWWRETAQRLIVERQDLSTVDRLTAMATQGKLPVARAHALWTLQGLGRLSGELVRQALADKSPRVREQAVMLCELLVPGMDEDAAADLLAAAQQLAYDDDARLRFQVALSVVQPQTKEGVAALAHIAASGSADPWTRDAVVLSSGQQAGRVAAAVIRSLRDRGQVKEDDVALVSSLSAAAGAADLKEGALPLVRTLLALPDEPGWLRLRNAGLTSLAQALSRERTPLATLGKTVDDEKLGDAIAAALARAEQAALNREADAGARRDAVALLAYSPQAEKTLASLALSEPATQVRLAAIGVLSRSSGLDTWEQLLDRFSRESPTIRSAILNGALARADRIHLLLDAIEKGSVKPGELDPAQSGRLIKHADKGIRTRSTKILADAIPADRQKVLADYQVVLQMKSDARRGQQIFTKNCATCHRIGEIGVNVAPDIGDSRRKTPEQILTDVLQPNRAIDANYISYSVITEDGQVLTGVLAAETASSVTLRQPEGKSVTLLRSEIADIKSNGISLMPEGLEKNVPPQDMADLIAFIKNWRYLDGLTPLGSQE